MSGDRDRRVLGLVVVALVLALIIAVPAAKPRLIDGIAVAVPIPGPPTIGDCVMAPTDRHWQFPKSDTDPIYPWVDTAPCTGERFGEIVHMVNRPVQPTVIGTANGYSMDDPNRDTCEAPVRQYVGAVPIADSVASWTPDLVWLQTTLSGPASRQVAAGQDWLACQISVPGGSEMTEAYGVSLRDAVSTGAYADELGVCLSSPESSSYGLGDCGRPHSFQRIATSDPLPEALDLDSATLLCSAVISRLTGIDQLPAEELAPYVSVLDDVGNVVHRAPALIAVGSLVFCGVITLGPRQLGGGLFGLGDSAIPWV